MRPSAQEQAAAAVIRHLVAGRDQALQISPGKLAEIAAGHGLCPDLPPPSAGMDQIWREHLLRELGGRSWAVGRRLWRVRCPHGGNLHLAPVPRRRR